MSPVEDRMRGASGPPDWNAVWMAMRKRQLATPGFLSGTEFFARSENAERYQRQVETQYRGFTERQLASMAIPDGATVLDIGTGPGTLAVPLAAQGCRVTAVEPSPPMRRALQGYADRRGVTVAVLEQPWEEIDPSVLGGPFDAVIASYSLLMLDLRAALAKMHAVCRGRVHLFYPLTPPGGRTVEKALWPVIHGADYPPEPMADCVWNLLVQMGIMATLEAEFNPAVHLFGDLDEAVAEFRDRLNHPPDSGAVLRSALDHLLTRDEDGAYRLDRSSWNAFIHWDVRGQPIGDGCEADA
ncbi:MAG: class I SAM-dependent methyltransferase [Methanospirillum sp.]